MKKTAITAKIGAFSGDGFHTQPIALDREAGPGKWACGVELQKQNHASSPPGFHEEGVAHLTFPPENPIAQFGYRGVIGVSMALVDIVLLVLMIRFFRRSPKKDFYNEPLLTQNQNTAP